MCMCLSTLYPFFESVEKYYNCNTCTRRYKNPESLWRHRKYECNKEPQFACYYCSYKAKQKSTLLNHVKRRHQ
ncbi:hypothetical protein M8J76_007512 [Diaphorina citri]|nr:hypothetical protein M8J76_007512 [Diaphorina citri]